MRLDFISSCFLFRRFTETCSSLCCFKRPASEHFGPHTQQARLIAAVHVFSACFLQTFREIVIAIISFSATGVVAIIVRIATEF